MSYRYIGSADLGPPGREPPRRIQVKSPGDVLRWAAETERGAVGKDLVATFIVDLSGQLWLADRRSEHVHCARGERVLSAGEITFHVQGATVEVLEVTNQSTGYCPEPESWPAVASALQGAGLTAPKSFTLEFTFRRCEACGCTNLVKEGWLECAVCQSPVAERWNF